MSPLSVPKFSPFGAHIRVLWRILQSVRNQEEQEKKKQRNNEILVAHISESSGAMLIKFGM